MFHEELEFDKNQATEGVKILENHKLIKVETLIYTFFGNWR